MDYSSYLQNRTAKPDALAQYGFSQSGNQWIYEQNLQSPNLLLRIELSNEKLTVRVIDQTFDDDFLPFSVQDSNNPVKAEVTAILQDILTTCFTNPCRDVIAYCENKYRTPHQAPWPDLPGYYTFKTRQRQKWYAIIMHLPAQRIGLTGDHPIDIINVKLPTPDIATLIDHQHYFPAYHMNKKYWLTILLDKQTDMPQLFNLLDRSYDLVEKQKHVSSSNGTMSMTGSS